MSNATENTTSLSLFQSFRLKMAARFIKRLLVRLPHDPSLLARVGLVELNLGHNEEAVLYFRQSLDVLSSDPNVHFNLGRALENLDNGNEALKCYKKAIALSSGFDEAVTRHALLLKRMKEKASQPAPRPSIEVESHFRKRSRANRGRKGR